MNKRNKSTIKYVYIVSLGCAKNLVDTEIMAADLIKRNIGITEDPEQASFFLLNTCSFILPAREESESYIQEAIKWKKKSPSKRKIIVSGCLTQWDSENYYYKKYKNIDLWIGIDQIKNLGFHISQLITKNNSKFKKQDKKFSHYSPSYIYDEDTPRLQLTPFHYANIKISEGCNNYCSYCTIPKLRGNLRSRSINSILQEAKQLLNNGAKELLIIAQDITAFGTDKQDPNENLTNLLSELDKIEGEHWVRLHYLHPEGITKELINMIAKSEHIIPYLDIPLQHISDKILYSMNRRISSQEVKTILQDLRNSINNLILRTTFLAGYPGENEEDFLELYNFIKEFKFERTGIFQFFPEKNTKAAGLKEQVPEELADERAEILEQLHAENSYIFNKQLVGRKYNVIIDTEVDNYLVGRTYMDSPNIDNIVKIEKDNTIKPGDFIDVKITDFNEYELYGTPEKG